MSHQRVGSLAPCLERRTGQIRIPFYLPLHSLPLLWYGINAVNDPPIKKPDYHHPSRYGAYLSGLALFVKMTGADVRELGAREQVAAELGIPGKLASRFQQEAWLAVRGFPLTWAGISPRPCSLVDIGE